MRRLLALFAALLAGGCALIQPDYQRPEMDLPQAH